MLGGSAVLVICTLIGGCLAIHGNHYLPEEQDHERRVREPFMNVMPPFLGLHPPPMMQGYGAGAGYAGRAAGNPTPYSPGGNYSYEANITTKYNDTKIYDSEYYEPNYCETLLIDELTKAVKYIVVYNLEGKYGKLKKYRYAVVVSAIIPEAVYDSLYKGDEIVKTITNALVEEYKYIPAWGGDPTPQEPGPDAFKEKIKYATTEILDGMCKYTYCCLKANRNVDYQKVADTPAYKI